MDPSIFFYYVFVNCCEERVTSLFFVLPSRGEKIANVREVGFGVVLLCVVIFCTQLARVSIRPLFPHLFFFDEPFVVEQSSGNALSDGWGDFCMCFRGPDLSR